MANAEAAESAESQPDGAVARCEFRRRQGGGNGTPGEGDGRRMGCESAWTGARQTTIESFPSSNLATRNGLTPSVAEDDRGVFLRELRDFA